MDLVGELVIAGATMKTLVERHGIDEMEEVVSRVEHLVEEIRDNALQLRMMPIGELFSRCRRLVEGAGADIELTVSGADTEIDKSVAEKISDPLELLVRHAIDSLKQASEQRLADGQPHGGSIRLNAYHDSGNLVIEVEGDAAGYCRELTLAGTGQAGPLTQDSGKAAVRAQVEALRGRVEWDGRGGEGTRVSIVLPLAHAIIDGFLVGSAGEHYVIPLAQVVECVEIDEDEQVRRQGHHYVNLRGEILPYLRLRDFFAIDAGDAERESLVVVRFGRTRAGLVVNELLGELQTVIKPLGKVFEQLAGVAGATVLGSGEIALILDVRELARVAHDRADSAEGMLMRA